MKRTLLYFCLMGLPLIAPAQTDTENNIYSTTYQKGFSKAQVDAGDPLPNDKLESVTYVDGMGRPKLRIDLRAGGNREDIVRFTEYDPLGREARGYLPYARSGSSSAAYIRTDTTKTAQGNFYDVPKYGNTENPYTEQRFEDSPRSRVLEAGAPGEAWEIGPNPLTNHTVRTTYALNGSNEVREFHISYASQTASPTLEYEGHYGSGQLTKVITADENYSSLVSLDDGSHVTHTFTDKQGRVVLKRTFDDETQMDTYYVYDNFGNLAYVLPPEASHNVLDGSNNVVTGVLDGLAYRYRYDHRNRLVEKKLPGRAVEYIFYDPLDRPILTQDGNMRGSDQYFFTKYDALDRVTYTGLYTHDFTGSTQADIQGEIDTMIASLDLHEERTTFPNTINGTGLYYTKNAFPSTPAEMEVHTVSYYDTYDDITTAGTPPATNHFGTPITTATKGLPTMSSVRVLDVSPQKWIVTVMGYDAKGREIYTLTEDPYLEKTDLTELQLDFTGRVLQSRSLHEDDSTGGHGDITITDWFTYDPAGRMVTHEQQVNDGDVQLLAKNHYDDMGQLEQKEVGGKTFVDGYRFIKKTDISPDGLLATVQDGNGWDSGVTTRGTIQGNGGISFTVQGENQVLKVGLVEGGTGLGGSFSADVDYGIQLSAQEYFGTGTFLIQYIADGDPPVFAGTTYRYEQGDVLSVERVGSTIVFKLNGATFHTDSTGIPTGDLAGKAAFYQEDGTLRDLELVGDGMDEPLQVVDYTYNVRGWLTGINDVDGLSDSPPDLFALRINYEGLDYEMTSGGADPLYNGNISQVLWRTAGDNTLRGYDYNYDGTDRLVKATGRQGSSLGSTAPFSLEGISYDRNGNLQALKRYGYLSGSGTVTWDDIAYGYKDDSNRLWNVAEVNGPTAVQLENGFVDGNDPSSTLQRDYEYDGDGNLTVDRNKGLEVAYNVLGLPVEVEVDNGAIYGSMDYVYDATGAKLKKTVNEGLQPTRETLYAGAYTYGVDGGDFGLQFIAHPEGYIAYSEEGVGKPEMVFDYVFQYTDHLGNVRLSYADANGDGAITAGTEIIEESDYYPFGLKHLGYNDTYNGVGNDLAQKWKYNGKELEGDMGVDWYDFGARNYEASIGRWMNIDPLAEEMRRHSPYNFAFNNPIYFMDADGMSPMPNAVTAFATTGSTAGLETGSGSGSGGQSAAPFINEIAGATVSRVEGGTDGGAIDTVGSTANQGMQSSGDSISSGSPPTDFVNESGETIASTDDNNDEVYVIRDENLEKFEAEMAQNVKNKTDLDKTTNQNLGLKYGYNIKDIKQYASESFPTSFGGMGDYGFEIGYGIGYGQDAAPGADFMNSMEDKTFSVGSLTGMKQGRTHLREGKMNMFNPVLKGNTPFITTNKRPRNFYISYSLNIFTTTLPIE